MKNTLNITCGLIFLATLFLAPWKATVTLPDTGDFRVQRTFLSPVFKQPQPSHFVVLDASINLVGLAAMWVGVGVVYAVGAAVTSGKREG